MANPETRLQIVVVEYLHAVLPRDAVFWSVPNEHKTTKKRGNLLNKMGRRAGVSDLMVLYRGKLFCIELKLRTDELYNTKRTAQTADQKAFETDVREAGAFYAVCRHTDEVCHFLEYRGVPINDKSLQKA